MKGIFASICGAVLIAGSAHAAPAPRSPEYAAVQERLQRGWNTWDTNTITGQVLLPYGLEVRLGIQRVTSENADAFLQTALIGRRGENDEQVFPGLKAYDGSYSDLRLSWQGIELRLQTARAGDDLVMLVTPIASKGLKLPANAVFSAGMLWNRPGSVVRDRAAVVAHLEGKDIPIFVVGDVVDDPHVQVPGPYLAARLSGPAGLSTGVNRSLAEIERIVAAARASTSRRIQEAGPAASVRGAIETVISWDTIYEPEGKRVVTPVSRIWNQSWGGYVLFEWDTFFAASLAAVENRDLAYANVIEVLNETTEAGMSPNYARAAGWKSSDRSEPPVGALTVLDLYRHFHEKWFLNSTYERLKRWNDWWAANRQVGPYLAWGSDATAPVVNPDDRSVGTLQGARFESGLDNSPMYDDAGYDGRLMQLADVGLISLYVADCEALAQIAVELGHEKDAATLGARAAMFRKGLDTLWDPVGKIYKNKDLRTGKLSDRLSPTNFYPLLVRAATSAQADAMIRNHLENPAEFGGDRVIPSIARNDPAFKDQDYWRGRIWGPMNYLVWLGLGKYRTPTAIAARATLAQRSQDLFLEEWKTNGHVHENYSAIGPDSDASHTSDRFYHWGALLGLIGPGVDPRLGSPEAH